MITVGVEGLGRRGCAELGDVREVISMAQLNVMYTFEQRESFAQMRKAKYKRKVPAV